METRPPTITRILVAIGFALSCFALALFLWITFGGPLPLKPEGYRVHGPLRRGHPARGGVRRADLRGLGGQGQGDRAIDNGRADATIELDSRYAPIPTDTRAMLRTKTLLGETFVELTPGDAQGPTLRREAGCRRPRSPTRCSSTRSGARSMPGRVTPSGSGCRGRPASLRGRGPTSRPRSPSWPASPRRRTACSACWTASDHAVRQLVHDGGTVFQALSERQGQLRGLIQNSETVFSTTARRNRELAELFRILPTFQRESRATLGAAQPLRRGRPTRSSSSCGPRRASSARPWSRPRRRRPI